MRELRADQGFSLTELIVVIALLTFVLGVAYTGLGAIQASRDVSDRQATFANEVGSPMLVIEEVLQQALRIESASAYTLTVTTDADNDNLIERHLIAAGTDGTLTHRTYNTNTLMQNTTLRLDATWSTNNANRAQAVPLFYFYDENHVPITDYAQVASDSKTMDVIVVVEMDGREFRSSRTVVLRNL